MHVDGALAYAIRTCTKFCYFSYLETEGFQTGPSSDLEWPGIIMKSTFMDMNIRHRCYL